MQIFAEDGKDSEGIRYAEAVAVTPDAVDGWSIMAGIMTVTEIQADHNEINVRLYGSHESMTVFYDDISIKPLPRMCDALVVNGDFEIGDTRFWLPNDRADIDVDVASFGANGSKYSMMITKYTTSRIRQNLDTRCLTEGQEFLISAMFKLVNSTETSTGLSCNPLIKNERDVQACPNVNIRGEKCAGGDLRYVYWNEKVDPWDANGFNAYESVYTVSADISTCEVSLLLLFTFKYMILHRK